MSNRTIVIEFLGKDKSVASTARGVESSTSRMGDRLKKVGSVAAAGFALAGVAAVKFGADAIGSASDLNETLSKSEAIFGKQAPAMESWAGAAARSAGLSKNAALSAAAGFGDMFSQIGFAGDQAAKMSKDVVQMSADLGSFNNLDTADVADRMSAAFRGEYDSLQAVIPNINAARVESEALAATGKKVASELTAQEKAAAVLAIVHKDGAKAQGDFARTSGGLANQQKILRAQFENVQASIGQKLLPVAVKLATFLNDDLLPAASRLGKWLQSNLGPIFDRVGEVISRVTSGMSGDTSKNLGAVLDTFKSITSIIRSLWKRFGGMLTDYAVAAFKNLRTIIGGALKVIQGIFKVFSSLLKGDWKGVWQGIKLIVSGALTVIKGMVKQSLNVLKLVFRVGWSVIKGVVAAAWDGIKALVSNGADRIVDGIKAIPGRIKALAGLFRDAGRWVIDAMVDGLKNAAGVVAGIAGNVWTAVRTMLNGAIDKINSALEFTIGIPGPDINVNPPNIPHLARGTSFHRGGLALVGEEGPELVNLPRGSQVKTARQTAALARGVGGRGGVTVNINGPVYGDPRAFARYIRTELLKEKRLLGAALGLA